jgi:hypothetical protein
MFQEQEQAGRGSHEWQFKGKMILSTCHCVNPNKNDSI